MCGCVMAVHPSHRFAELSGMQRDATQSRVLRSFDIGPARAPELPMSSKWDARPRGRNPRRPRLGRASDAPRRRWCVASASFSTPHRRAATLLCRRCGFTRLQQRRSKTPARQVGARQILADRPRSIAPRTLSSVDGVSHWPRWAENESMSGIAVDVDENEVGSAGSPPRNGSHPPQDSAGNDIVVKQRVVAADSDAPRRTGTAERGRFYYRALAPVFQPRFLFQLTSRLLGLFRLVYHF